MEEANDHMAIVLNEIQERLFSEDKALAREKAVARIRAKIPLPQTKLGDTTTAKELKKKGLAEEVSAKMRIAYIKDHKEETADDARED